MLAPIVIGINSIKLSDRETELISKINPVGIILFKRNIESIEQTKSLINNLKFITQNSNLLIFIDEEGGKVSRTNHLFDESIISAQEIGKTYEKNNAKGLELLNQEMQKLISRLKSLGINSCCMPDCDLFFADSDQIIGTRAYSDKVETVVTLAKKCCETLIENKILPVIKHIPGHGRANCDSHLDLPRIKTKQQELNNTDFKVFSQLQNMPIAMTAHIVYEDIDPLNSATTSNKLIKFIRNNIGFNNILISDDICMKALKGSNYEKISQSFNSGCDIVLHCNGNINEIEEIYHYVIEQDFSENQILIQKLLTYI
ncbi:MAG: glycoside hydrolase family 3 protein [Rickettsiales bacterium]|nr:glycoside hydrolase family 3 protein [Rickettsiales bacterium]